MKFLIVGLLVVTITSFSFTQDLDQEKLSGTLEVGARSTLSLFNDHADESVGRGIGGQFRLRFSDRVNTEWFFDYLNSSIGNYAQRTDYHIGWSVLYYPLKPNERTLYPYVLAGHCFDYTLIKGNRADDMSANRWSSAVQGGLGMHYKFTSYFDVSLTGQYMMHLGKHLHGHLKESGEFHIHEEGSNALEGHLLVNLSFNFKIGKLW